MGPIYETSGQKPAIYKPSAIHAHKVHHKLTARASDVKFVHEANASARYCPDHGPTAFEIHPNRCTADESRMRLWTRATEFEMIHSTRKHQQTTNIGNLYYKMGDPDANTI